MIFSLPLPLKKKCPMCLGFAKKKERERGNQREKRYEFCGRFSLPFSLSVSLSFASTERTKFRAKRATTKNDTTRHYVCSTKHEFYRRESCRGEIRQDDATVRLLFLLRGVVFGARLCTFLRFKLVSLSLSDGMMVRISSRPEQSARARVFFPRVSSPSRRTRAVASGRGRIVDTVVGLFLRRRLADIIRSNRSLSLFHISLPQKQIGF